MRVVGLGLVVAIAVLAGSMTRGHQPIGGAQHTILTRRFTPADQTKDRYQYVPFQVPPGTGTLRITYQYDRAGGENVIDLGLFEPGPLDLGTRAFRGYSGGSKASIIIGTHDTKPGYRAGPLPEGQWHVLLGLYKISASGVDVRVSVETQEGPTPRIAPEYMRRSNSATARSALRWYAGALHTHTLHSDGTLSPSALIELAQKSRLDFVAITDHNTVTHQEELAWQKWSAPSPLVIVGEEVTTPGGHASVWGLGPSEWVDFRVAPKDGRIGDLISTTHGFGALFSVNHPASQCAGCGWSHEWVDGIDAIEVSNGQHGEVARALSMWDDLLRAGRRITAVGSSDWHRSPSALDDAHVRVLAPGLTEAAILEAIKQGRVIVMRNVRDATPDVTVSSGKSVARVGETLALEAGSPVIVSVVTPVMSGAQMIVVADGEQAGSKALDLTGQARLEVPAPRRYLRVELRGVDGTPLAIVNPVYTGR